MQQLTLASNPPAGSIASNVQNQVTGGGTPSSFTSAAAQTVSNFFHLGSVSQLIVLIIGVALIILGLLTFAFSEVFSADTLKQGIKGAATAAVA